jgi:hypothetical protein
MFDSLRNAHKTDAVTPSYIVHAAAGPPDDSLHPIHNAEPELDFVTWETLPTELKKVRPPRRASRLACLSNYRYCIEEYTILRHFAKPCSTLCRCSC